VAPNMDGWRDQYLWQRWSRSHGIVGVSSDSEFKYLNAFDSSSKHMSPIWRIYPLSEHSKGFTLRPVNIEEIEDIAKKSFCKYLGFILSFNLFISLSFSLNLCSVHIPSH